MFYMAFFVCQQCDAVGRTRLIFNINLHYAHIEVRGAERSGAERKRLPAHRIAPQHRFL